MSKGGVTAPGELQAAVYRDRTLTEGESGKVRSLPPSKEEDQARATWSQVEALRFICIECEMVQAAQRNAM